MGQPGIPRVLRSWLSVYHTVELFNRSLVIIRRHLPEAGAQIVNRFGDATKCGSDGREHAQNVFIPGLFIVSISDNGWQQEL